VLQRDKYYEVNTLGTLSGLSGKSEVRELGSQQVVVGLRAFFCVKYEVWRRLISIGAGTAFLCVQWHNHSELLYGPSTRALDFRAHDIVVTLWYNVPLDTLWLFRGYYIYRKAEPLSDVKCENT